MSVNLFEKVISDPNFNPLDIFRLPRNYTLKQLTKQYRKKALRYHPDKGGDALKYNIVKYAYTLLCEEHEKRTYRSNDYREMKTQSQNFNKLASERVDKKRDIVGMNFNLNRFNDHFQAHKISFEDSEGYDSWIADTGTTTSPTHSPPKKHQDTKGFNKDFETSRKSRTQRKNSNVITVYKEPAASSVTKLKFSDVDLSKPKSFHNNTMTPDIHFSDYKDAYTQSDITNVQVEDRVAVESVDALQKLRSNVQHSMSKSDQMKYTAKLELEKRQERERQQRIRYQNMKIKNHFDKVNSLMLQ